MSVLCLLVCFILSLGVFRATASDTYGNFSGSGTEAEPFLIGTPQEMAALIDWTNDNTNEAKYYLGADGVQKYFKITADLDMQDYPINGYGIGVYGKEYCTINISSHFDGGNHVIKNLTMTHDSHALGLFGQVYGGSIKNLGLENAKLTSTHSKISRAGFIAFDTRGGSSAVDHCYVINSTLSVSAVTGSIIGGIVGNNNLEAVTNCYTLNNTYPDMTGIEVSFGSVIGGGVGRASNCYSDVAPIAGGAKYSSSNAVVTYTVVPDDNYKYTVTVNGSEVATDANHQFAVTVSEATEIIISFEIKNHVYPGIASAVSFVTGEYAGYPSIVAYNKLNAFTTGETGLEYGMKIWQDEEQQLVLPMYQTNEVLDQATPNQSFAIRVFGEAIVTGKRYFMQPYVGETEGEAKEITIE